MYTERKKKHTISCYNINRVISIYISNTNVKTLLFIMFLRPIPSRESDLLLTSNNGSYSKRIEFPLEQTSCNFYFKQKYLKVYNNIKQKNDKIFFSLIIIFILILFIKSNVKLYLLIQNQCIRKISSF